jgi:hypothetical protein
MVKPLISATQHPLPFGRRGNQSNDLTSPGRMPCSSAERSPPALGCASYRHPSAPPRWETLRKMRAGSQRSSILSLYTLWHRVCQFSPAHASEQNCSSTNPLGDPPDLPGRQQKFDRYGSASGNSSINARCLRVLETWRAPPSLKDSKVKQQPDPGFLDLSHAGATGVRGCPHAGICGTAASVAGLGVRHSSAAAFNPAAGWLESVKRISGRDSWNYGWFYDRSWRRWVLGQ